MIPGGELLSIDEGDLFGKRKQIFNKNDWCRRNASMDMVNSLLEDMRLAEDRMGSILPVEIIISVDEDGKFEDIQDVAVITFSDKLSKYISNIPEIGKVVSVSDYL